MPAPPVIETPTRAPARSQRPAPSFLRRLLVSLARLLVVLSVSVLLGGGWYLAKKGFGRQWRLRVVEELHKRGVEASIRRLTLNPFRGLVAQDVRIYDYKNREKTLARISEISLDINYSALLHHQPFLNAIDIRNAQVSLPLKQGETPSRRAQLKNFRAHVYFPPEQIYVSQAEGLFCGVRVSITGQLIKRQDYLSSPPSAENDWEPTLALLRRVVSELQKFYFPGGSPTLQVKFTGDVAQLENARVEATLRGDRIARGDYKINDLMVAADWSDQKLNVTQCEWKDDAGMAAITGTWDKQQNEASFQARSSIDAKAFLLALGMKDTLADAEFAKPPLIEVSGTADFSGEQPRFRIIGHGNAPAFSYRSVPWSDLAVDFSWDGERVLLRDFQVEQGTGQVRADLISAPGDFRLNLHSTINPAAIKPYLGLEARKALDEWEWQRAPTVDLTIRGTDRNPATWQARGTLALNRTKFRGTWMNSGSANVQFSDGAISYENIRVSRNEGVATGAFTYDFKNHEVRVSNIKSSLNPSEIILWVNPELYKTVKPYRFRHSPNVHADGVYQFAGGKKTRLDLTVDAPGGMDYTFLGKTLPFDRVSAKLAFTNDRLEIADLRADLFSGKVSGFADISLAHGDSHYKANVVVRNIDFPRLTTLYYGYKTSQGELSGSYDFKAAGPDPRSMQGTGKIDVTNGNVFAIPVFGPLSEILNSVVPGSGYSIARKAEADFTIKNGIIHTENFEAAGSLFSMLGHGDIHFLDDKLDFDVRMNMHGPGVLLTPVYKLFEYVGEGSLKKPVWHSRMF